MITPLLSFHYQQKAFKWLRIFEEKNASTLAKTDLLKSRTICPKIKKYQEIIKYKKYKKITIFNRNKNKNKFDDYVRLS